MPPDLFRPPIYRFLLGLLSATGMPDEPRQREMAATITPALARAGLRIEQTDEVGVNAAE